MLASTLGHRLSVWGGRTMLPSPTTSRNRNFFTHSPGRSRSAHPRVWREPGGLGGKEGDTKLYPYHRCSIGKLNFGKRASEAQTCRPRICPPGTKQTTPGRVSRGSSFLDYRPICCLTCSTNASCHRFLPVFGWALFGPCSVRSAGGKV